MEYFDGHNRELHDRSVHGCHLMFYNTDSPVDLKKGKEEQKRTRGTKSPLLVFNLSN
jgi:hypothetical protein